MNYLELYQQLVQFRKSNILNKQEHIAGEIESHHIIPRSCGGTDDPENLVNLYAKEHFMAHYYLWKIHENDEFKYPLLNALWNMCSMSSSKQNRTYLEYIKMSKEYQQIRIEFAKYQSNWMSTNKNPMHGRHWYYDPITLVTKPFIENKQPAGWLLGKVPKKEKPISRLQFAKDEVRRIKTSGKFDLAYGNKANNRQVKRYLISINGHICFNCKQEFDKLYMHNIDGDLSNLNVDNYELLCKECYFKSGNIGWQLKK